MSPTWAKSSTATEIQPGRGAQRAPACSPGARCAPLPLTLIAIQRRDQQPRAYGEHGHARGHLAGVLLREGLSLRAGALQIVARGVQVLVDVDVLHLRAEIIDHLLADAELAEELLEAAVAAERLA